MALEQPDKRSFIYFIVGVVLALIIWGSQLIGVAINIWFGGFILAIAFALVVYAFWIWERTSNWHVLLRIGTILVAAAFYFLLVGRQMSSEWNREHPIALKSRVATSPSGNSPTQKSPNSQSKLGKSETEISKTNSTPKKQNQPVLVPPGSMVQSNSGGTNIQQGTTGPNSPIIDSPITVGSVPKDISQQDMNSIVTYLSSAPTKASIKVVADQFSGNAPFPDKFYNALKRSGWPMLDDGVVPIVGMSAPGKKFQGAVVIIKGEPLKPGQTFYPDTPSDPLNYIGSVLEHLHIPRILQRDPNIPEGQIYVQFEGGFPD